MVMVENGGTLSGENTLTIVSRYGANLQCCQDSRKKKTAKVKDTEDDSK